MTLLTSSTDTGGLLGDQIGKLIVQPTMDMSIAAQVATLVSTSSHTYRLPVVATDPTAAWVAEGAEITPSDAVLEELVVTPKKLAGLSILSRELAEDFSPAASKVVGEGLARDLSRKLDTAFFANTTTNGPSGLLSLTTSTTVAAYTSTDVFAAAIPEAETFGARVNYFVTTPAVALTLAQLKKATGSNEPLLGSDPTKPGTRTILGVPLLVSSAVSSGVVWGIDSSFVQVVVREGTRLEVDRSAYFSSDRVGVKATMRVGFAFPHPLSIQKITAA
jgi:HK97 family phage major capsid protein